jgi:hypothetical protein
MTILSLRGVETMGAVVLQDETMKSEPQTRIKYIFFMTVKI